MKVVAFNGSPRKDGNTAQLIGALGEGLRAEGVSLEKIDICEHRPRGCIACNKCKENRDERCVIEGDPLNEWLQEMKEADGVVLGSPTYFANVSAEMKALIDRAGYVSRANDVMLRRKVAAAVVAVRRAGALPAFDAMNHMFMINQMLIVGSSYWNLGLGGRPGDVAGDDEAMANMKNLAENMAWAIKKLRG